jgi:phosphoglycolate phosphatase
MNEVRLVVFDCDGTLMDSQGLILEAMQLAYDGKGFEAPDRSDVRRIIGLSLEVGIAELSPELGPDQHAVLAAQFREHFTRFRADPTMLEPLYPSVREVLEELNDTGFVLAVATGKNMRGLRHVLEQHKLDRFFTSLQTPDHAPSKPHPGMLENAMDTTGARAEHTVMIGDTTFDMEMAINAKTTAIGVDWGYHEVNELHLAGAHKVISNMTDLHEVLEGTA